MTVIAGVIDNTRKTVWIGADSGVTGDDDTGEIATATKLFAAPGADIVVGFAGNVRLAQIMQHAVLAHIAEVRNERDTESWLVTSFYKVCHDAFVEFGAMKGDDAFNMSGVFMIGVGTRLFTVDNNFEVVEATRGYDAIGSGREIALGSLFATNYADDPEVRIYGALRAASEHMPHIKRPFVALNTRVHAYYDLSETYDADH